LYIAPELFDDVPASVQSDIYALGVLLYRLVSGAFPVEADSVEALQEAHRQSHRPLPDVRPDLPAAFAACIERAISRDPAERYASAAEFSAALEGSTNHSAFSRRRVIGLAAILALAAAVFVTWPSQYQFDVTLLRIGNDNSRTILETGSVVAVGDQLVLELTATRPLYVYVFNEDALGNAWGLFPLGPPDDGNPLAPGETHALPGDDLSWTVDSAGIVDRIHILASPHFDERVAEQFAALPSARLVDAGFGSRGVGSVTRRDGSPKVSATAIIQLAQELAATGEMLSGVSYRVIELQNPK
jgi:hypothetical protein